MLVGRASEMRELEDALDDVRTKKHSRTVTVLGAPGVGKTRLVREFLVRAHTHGGEAPRVFRGSAREKGPSYGVFGRVLRSRFGVTESMEDEPAKAAIRTHLAKVLEDRKVGDVAYFLGQLMDLEFVDSPLIKAVEDDREQIRQLRSAVIRRFFEADAAAQPAPLVLVFDDLHYAHDDSLDLLEHLVHAVSGPILIVRVARSELVARRDGWKRNDAKHTTVEISPLSETDAAAMIQDLLAPCGEGEAVEDLIDAACTLAGGNPALLEQMVRIYHDMGVLEIADPLAEEEVWKIHPEKVTSVKLPITIEDAITARIAALAPSERELLERAAAVGDVFWLNALAVMHRTAAGAPNVDPATWAGGETPDVARVREILKDLRERDYVLRLPDSTFSGDEEYVFKHNKERETLQRLTPPGAARSYHAAIAEWLSSKDGALHEEYVAMLARHREKAGLKTLAAQSYLRAADIARDRYANAVAAEYYGRALELHAGGAEITADEHLHALHHHGDVLQVLGKVDAALHAFRAMLKEAFRLDRRGNAGAAHSRLGRYYRDTGRLSEADQHLRAALALFKEAGDDRGIASTKDDIGKWHWLRGDYAKALEATQAALVMRRRIGDRRSIALSLNNLGLVYQDSGQFRHALDAFEQALLIRREIGDLRGVAITLNNLGTVAQDQREDQRALALFQEALEVAKETGERNRIALVFTNLGETLTRLGESDRAIDYLKQAEELCDELGDKFGLAEAVRGLGKAYLACREYTRARECIGRAVQIFEQVQSRIQLAIALRALGEVTAAGSAGGEDLRRARTFFQESIRIFQEAGNEVELGRSLRAFGEALKHSPDIDADPALKKEVEDARKKAEDIFARLKLDALGL